MVMGGDKSMNCHEIIIMNHMWQVIHYEKYV